jgi:L-fuculose-phosphate aldolase
MSENVSDTMGLKEKLALACRILGTNGHDDLHLGHISVRADDRDQFMYIKGHEVCLSEVQVEDINTSDFQGNKLEGKRPPHNEWPIHTEIYKKRSDINCVVHTHPFYATTLSASTNIIRPVSHDGIMFAGEVPFLTSTTDLIFTTDLGAALAEKLGDGKAVLMKNHGITTAGVTIEEATLVAFHLERAAKYQLFASLHGDVSWPDDEEVERKKKKIFVPEKMNRTWNTLARSLEREEAVFRLLRLSEKLLHEERP